jgi:uncharacterized membrane protein YfcA
MEPLELLLVAGIGLVSGALNVLAGGGSLLVMPLLLELGLSGPAANGTARLGILSQNGAAIARFWRGGFRARRTTFLLIGAALPGAALGAFYGSKLEGQAFRYVLSGVMVGVWLWMTLSWLRKRKVTTSDDDDTPQEEAPEPVVKWWGLLALVAVGFYGGFIQAGVGFLFMVVLNRVLGFDLVRVNAMKVWIVFSYTIIAVAVFVARDAVVPLTGAVLACGTGLGGYLGARLSLTRGEGLIRVVFSVALAALVARLLFF